MRVRLAFPCALLASAQRRVHLREPAVHFRPRIRWNRGLQHRGCLVEPASLNQRVRHLERPHAVAPDGDRLRPGVDRGFVLSDHVDWPGLMETIAATGAKEVHVTHGFVTPVVRMLREKGIDARPLKAKFAADDTTED